MTRKHSISLLFFIYIISGLTRFDIFTTDIQGIHVWRQSITMWNVRNFARYDNNILNPRLSNLNGDDCTIQRNEFPLFQWSLAQIQNVFGEEPLVFRVFLYILGGVGVMGMFLIFRFIHGREYIALLSSVTFLFSPLFYYYSLTPSPDLLALVSAIWYIYFHLRLIKNRRFHFLILCAICLCIASLAKLPYLMFGIISVSYFIKKIVANRSSIRGSLTYILTHIIILIPFFMWYGWVMPTWDADGVLFGVFKNPLPWERTQHILSYYLNTMIPKILLTPYALAIVLLGIVSSRRKSSPYNYLFTSLIVLTMLYWILEYNMIDVNHDYYLLPLLPWIFYLASWGIKFCIERKSKILHGILLAVLVMSCVYCHKNTIMNWSLEKTFNNDDLFKYRTKLKNAVPIDELCIILNDESSQIFSYQIDKRGYVFQQDHLPLHWIHDMVLRKNVKYMYSDSEIINTAAMEGGYIDRLIIKRGSISVYELKLP